MKTLPGKKTAANTITVVGLFLFSIGAFNLPGQIFFALTLSYGNQKLLYSKSRSWHCSFFQRHILLSTRFISGLR